MNKKINSNDDFDNILCVLHNSLLFESDEENKTSNNNNNRYIFRAIK